MSTVQRYYVPEPTPWPILGCVALPTMAIGAAAWVNRASQGPYIVAAGVLLLLVMLIGWFGTVIREGDRRLYNGQVETSFRQAMAWFIFTEAIVFGALFGALFYLRLYAVPHLASGETATLWPGFHPGWPTAGHEDRDTVAVPTPVVDLLHGAAARQDCACRFHLVEELRGGLGWHGPGRLGVAVPVVQPGEAVAAGVARFVVRTRDVPVE